MLIKLKFLHFLIVCLLLIVPVRSYADVNATNVQVSTPDYSGQVGDFSPQLGTYRYRVSWSGIPAAKISLEVAKSGNAYQVTTKVKSSAAVRLLYSLDYFGQGSVSADRFRPLQTKIVKTENSRTKTDLISFESPRAVSVVRTDSKYKGRVLKDTFDPQNNLFDPFSATLFAISLDWQIGQKRHFDVLTGKSRYLISFQHVKTIAREVNGIERKVWVLVPAVKKVSSDSRKKNKLRSAEIFITADGERELLEIVSDVFIGSVRTEIESFTPAGSKAAIKYKLD